MSDIDTNSPEFKQAVSDAVATAVSEATEGLKTKNTELLGKLKKAQQGQQIDPAELQAVETERDQLKQQLNDASKATKKLTGDLEAATKRADEVSKAYADSMRDAALTDELTKAGVTNPVHLKAAKAILGGAVEVVNENGATVVKAGDKALGDFITEWAGGDEGKHFRVNGAEGGNAHALPPGSDTNKRSSMTVAQKADYIGKHGLDAYNNLPD